MKTTAPVIQRMKYTKPKKYCSLILLLCVFNQMVVSGQSVIGYDTVYKTDFSNKMVLKINANTRTDNYILENANSATRYKLEPNSVIQLNFSLNYDFLSLNIGFSPRFLSGNESLKGKSKFSTYQFRFFFNRLVQELHYRGTKGYYVANTRDFVPNWQKGSDPYIRYPNFKSIQATGATAYILNPHFSLKSLIHHTEFQKKSAGSFVPELRYGYYKIANLIDGQETFDKAVQFELAASYYYNWVIEKNWFVALIFHHRPDIGFPDMD